MSDRIAYERVTILHTFHILCGCSYCVCVSVLESRLSDAYLGITFSSNFKVHTRWMSDWVNELSLTDWESDLKQTPLTLTVELVCMLRRMPYLQFVIFQNKSNSSLLTFNFSSSSSLRSLVSCLLCYIFRVSIVPPITDVSHHLHSQFQMEMYILLLNFVSQRLSALFNTIVIVEFHTPFALNATIFIVYSFDFPRRSLW